MKKLFYTRQGNLLLCACFWTAFLGGWGAFHAVGFSPLGSLGLSGGCLIKRMTGFSCISCGLTRMLDSLIRFDLITAFRYNPYFMLFGALLLAVCVGFTFGALRPHYAGPLLPRPRIWHAVALALSLVAFVLVRNTSLYLSCFYV